LCQRKRCDQPDMTCARNNDWIGSGIGHGFLHFMAFNSLYMLLCLHFGLFSRKAAHKCPACIRYDGGQTIIMQQIGADCEKTNSTQGHEAKEGYCTAGKGIFGPSSY